MSGYYDEGDAEVVRRPPRRSAAPAGAVAFVPTPRKPTGVPAAPLIMVSGQPKVGKSMTAYKLGRSPRINATWVIDLGEGSADEYGKMGCYEVLEWGRSFVDLQDTVRWCVAQPCPEGLMNAVILDSGTDLWDSLKSRADKRARRSKKNMEALKNDPDYEVDVSMPYWNDAKDTWARIISPMKLAGHLVGVVIVATEVVSEVINGAPTRNKVTSYQCEKTLPRAATAHVSVLPDHTAVLLEARSMHVSVGPQGLVLDADNPLGDLVDRLSPSGTFAAPVVTSPIDDQRDNPDRISDEAAAELVAAMNQVADDDDRKVLKGAFVTVFAKPSELTADRFDEAMAWVQGRVGRLNETEPGAAGPYAEDAAAAADEADLPDDAPSDETPPDSPTAADTAPQADEVAPPPDPESEPVPGDPEPAPVESEPDASETPSPAEVFVEGLGNGDGRPVQATLDAIEDQVAKAKAARADPTTAEIAAAQAQRAEDTDLRTRRRAK